MDIKVLEIRDEHTHIPAMAIRMKADNHVQAYYVHDRSGYPRDGRSIMLMMLSDGRATNDPYDWGKFNLGPRTMPVAHDWIIRHFDELRDGDVVDVRHVLGEIPAPAISERLMEWRIA